MDHFELPLDGTGGIYVENLSEVDELFDHFAQGFCATTPSGDLYCWGDTSYGAISEIPAYNTPQMSSFPE